MTSHDVNSLFTNIPLNETINNWVSDLHNKNLYNRKFSKKDLFKLLETAAGKSSLIFYYELYKEVDGVAMPSLGPTLTNAFLCYYEKECFDNYPVNFIPVI